MLEKFWTNISTVKNPVNWNFHIFFLVYCRTNIIHHIFPWNILLESVQSLKQLGICYSEVMINLKKY